MTLEALLSKLCKARREGSEWKALCPAHGDKNPSLSIRQVDGKTLIHCHAGCTTEAVLAALGIEARDLFDDGGGGRRIVEEYDYCDEKSELLYQVVRFDPKDFCQRRPDGNGGWIRNLNGTRRVLYRLPDLIAARSVLLCEGEKDCETARRMGLVATCNPHGAGKWRPEYSESLRGKRVCIIADADQPGRNHAQEVATSLHGKAESLRVIEVPNAKDLSEWVEKDGTREALLVLIRNAPEWKQQAITSEIKPEKRATAITRSFSEIAPQELRWLWPGRIPLGKLTLLIGDPGHGKSLVTIDIASRVTRGAAFPDGVASEAGSVILLSAEDDPGDTIRPRLDATGADVSRVHVLEAVRVPRSDGSLLEKGFNLETDIAVLDDVLNRLPDARLIVIDPISAYLGGTDSHTNAEVRGLLAPFSQLAAKYGVAILAVTHLRKSSGAAVHRAIASIGFAAAARAVWAVAPDPEDLERRLMLPVKQNLAANTRGISIPR